MLRMQRELNTRRFQFLRSEPFYKTLDIEQKKLKLALNKTNKSLACVNMCYRQICLQPLVTVQKTNLLKGPQA